MTVATVATTSVAYLAKPSGVRLSVSESVANSAAVENQCTVSPFRGRCPDCVVSSDCAIGWRR